MRPGWRLREATERLDRQIGIEPDHHHPSIGAGDGLHPFRRAPEDQAGDPEPSRLTLDPARVGDDGRGVHLERERRSVALRLDQVDGW
jgi:hypothetical protein